MATAGLPLGNLLRMESLDLVDLPLHPALPSSPPPTRELDSAPEQSDSSALVNTSASRPDLVSFVTAVIREASAFIDAVPGTFQSAGRKHSPPAVAPVSQYKRMITTAELHGVFSSSATVSRKVDRRKLRDEAWFARKSIHVNEAADGTADWLEFDSGLRVNHSENEKQYTPDIYDTFKVLDWNEQLKGMAFEHDISQVTMYIYEMVHKIPWPLKPRAFSVLVITAKTGVHELLVAQIPVDLRRLPQAMYSNGRNLKEGKTGQCRKEVVLGAYTSIEKCRIGDSPSNVEWTVATGSDAKGWLPMWLQKTKVPGALLQDVGMFVKWSAARRSKQA